MVVREQPRCGGGAQEGNWALTGPTAIVRRLGFSPQVMTNLKQTQQLLARPLPQQDSNVAQTPLWAATRGQRRGADPAVVDSYMFSLIAHLPMQLAWFTSSHETHCHEMALVDLVENT